MSNNKRQAVEGKLQRVCKLTGKSDPDEAVRFAEGALSCNRLPAANIKQAREIDRRPRQIYRAF